MRARVDITEQMEMRRETLRAEIEKKGLAFPEKPGYGLPSLPTNLTALTDRQVMRLLARFTRYQDFAQHQLAEAEIDEAHAEARLDLSRAKFLVKSWTGNSSDRVTISKAEATVDPVVQKYFDTFQVCKAKRKLLAVLEQSIGRDAAVISREVTRRVGRDPVERRTDRWASP